MREIKREIKRDKEREQIINKIKIDAYLFVK